ncbi:MAG: YceI family protein [Chloroflexota bacterium]|nr:YceI family protein [Chloroflexota bacterium]MDE3101331.1 YceI family protein [Chloroflexota bacterium]
MKWQFDPAHTSVEASAKHMMFTTVRVDFPATSGEIDLDPDRPETAHVRLTIPVASLRSNDPKRDAHLRSADFFDTEHHGEITFESRSVKRAEKDRYTVIGDLTIRGTTKPATVTASLLGVTDDPMGKGRKRAFIDAQTRIDRRDWGLVWNMPVPQGVLVSHEITLEVSAQATSVEEAASQVA